MILQAFQGHCWYLGAADRGSVARSPDCTGKKSVTPSCKRKTGKAVRYQFAVGDVLLESACRIPLCLSKEDKSLAKILCRGSPTAARWSRQGGDLVYTGFSGMRGFSPESCQKFVSIPLGQTAHCFESRPVGGRSGLSRHLHTPSARCISFSEGCSGEGNCRGFPFSQLP